MLVCLPCYYRTRPIAACSRTIQGMEQQSETAAENAMQSINTHLKILIFIMVSLGLLVTGYQIWVLEIPIREDEPTISGVWMRRSTSELPPAFRSRRSCSSPLSTRNT